jgi:hypothetical protein
MIAASACRMAGTGNGSVRYRVARLTGLACMLCLGAAGAAGAATAGLPFTEDFSDASRADPDLTTAEWDTRARRLRLGRLPVLESLTWTRARLGSAPRASRAIATADFNGDGWPDIVVGNQRQEDRIFLNDGAGGFHGEGERLSPDTLGTRGIAAGDVDNDGDVDLVAGNFQGLPRLYLNLGNGRFASGTKIGAKPMRTWKVLLVDVDRDGDLDLLIANSGATRNRIFYNSHSQTGQVEWRGEDLGRDFSKTYCIDAGDVNGDGYPDVVAGNNQARNKLYLNRGDGTFADGSNLTAEVRGTQGIAFADVNGDGSLDVIEAAQADATRLYLNDGSGHFGASTPVGPPDRTSVALAIADFDRDGDVDFVQGNNRFAKRYFPGLGDGSFGLPLEIAAQERTRTYAVAVADFNRDGLLDFAAAHQDAPNLVYQLAARDGRREARQVSSVAVSARVGGDDLPAVPSVRLTARDRKGPLDRVRYFVSNDRGAHFVEAAGDGSPVAFPDPAGNDLRWKAELTAGSPANLDLPVVESIAIAVDRAPARSAALPPALTAAEDAPASFDLSGLIADPDGDPLTWSLRGLPADSGLTLHPRTGILAGTPGDADSTGNAVSYWVLTLRATDGAHAASVTFGLRVGPVNDPPRIASQARPLSTAPGVPITISADAVEVSDPDDSRHELIILEGAQYTTGSALVTPAQGVNGTFPVRVRVRDPHGGLSEPFDLAVQVE